MNTHPDYTHRPSPLRDGVHDSPPETSILQTTEKREVQGNPRKWNSPTQRKWIQEARR